MTIGIYSIFLGEYNRYYVGQSVDIERRIVQHKSLLHTNTHYNKLMQNAFNKSSIFNTDILVECEISELDSKEVEFMASMNSLTNGYNIAAGGKSGRGLNHGSCKYTEEQIVNAFILLLNPNNSFEFISEITELSISSIRHLSRRETHKWLDELYPEQSANLIFMIDSDIRRSINSKNKCHKYNKLKDSYGNIYEVLPTIKLFSKMHELDPNKVGALLLGNRKSHKGWTAVNEGIEKNG